MYILEEFFKSIYYKFFVVVVVLLHLKAIACKLTIKYQKDIQKRAKERTL